jgi:hypothetical protein
MPQNHKFILNDFNVILYFYKLGIFCWLLNVKRTLLCPITVSHVRNKINLETEAIINHLTLVTGRPRI